MTMSAHGPSVVRKVTVRPVVCRDYRRARGVGLLTALCTGLARVWACRNRLAICHYRTLTFCVDVTTGVCRLSVAGHETPPKTPA